MNIPYFKNRAQEVLDKVSGFISDAPKVLNNVSVDHLNYKCGSREEFRDLVEKLEKNSRFIFQSVVSGRSILIVGVPEDWNLECNGCPVKILEIQDRKPGVLQKSGFTHVEVALGAGCLCPESDKYATLSVVLPSHGINLHNDDLGPNGGHYCVIESLSTKDQNFEMRFIFKGILEKIAETELDLVLLQED